MNRKVCQGGIFLAGKGEARGPKKIMDRVWMTTAGGTLIPFVGTTLGAACVL